MKYIDRTAIVEAFRYDGDLKGSDGKYYVPEWAVTMFETGILFYDSACCCVPPCFEQPRELYAKTFENNHQHVAVGDYVVLDTRANLHVIKPDMFEKNFESVDYSNLSLMAKMDTSEVDESMKKLKKLRKTLKKVGKQLEELNKKEVIIYADVEEKK